jgi:hypothetical protein
MFQKFNLGPLKSKIENQIVVKTLITELIDSALSEHLSAVSVPRPPAFSHRLSREASSEFQPICLREAHFQKIIKCTEKSSGHDQDCQRFDGPINFEVSDSYKPVLQLKLAVLKNEMSLMSQRVTTPRFGSIPVPSPDNVSAPVSEEPMIELPNTPKIMNRIRQWESITRYDVEKESFRTTAPS